MCYALVLQLLRRLGGGDGKRLTQESEAELLREGCSSCRECLVLARPSADITEMSNQAVTAGSLSVQNCLIPINS